MCEEKRCMILIIREHTQCGRESTCLTYLQKIREEEREEGGEGERFSP
jgi:hypothetical protein